MSHAPKEPAVGDGSSALLRYFLATRPAFLLATLAACILGFASAKQSVELQAALAVMTILLAFLMHAGVNVLNDYFDALNGTDALNEGRLYPFTGGSRYIQNGLLTIQQTARYGYALLILAMFGGLWLVSKVGVGLLIIGAAGVFVGWAYSALPLRLNSRGLGEICVLLGFLGVVIGADYVQRQSFAWQPVIVGMPYALLVTNLLFINQFPDAAADASVGKWHWVVRLSAVRACWVYPCLAVLAMLWLVLAVIFKGLPTLTLAALAFLFFSWRATQDLFRYCEIPTKLRPAIQWTLAAMLSHALLLTLLLFWNIN